MWRRAPAVLTSRSLSAWVLTLDVHSLPPALTRTVQRGSSSTDRRIFIEGDTFYIIFKRDIAPLAMRVVSLVRFGQSQSSGIYRMGQVGG